MNSRLPGMVYFLHSIKEGHVYIYGNFGEDDSGYSALLLFYFSVTLRFVGPLDRLCPLLQSFCVEPLKRNLGAFCGA